MDLQAIWTALYEGKGSDPETNKILHRFIKGEEPPDLCPDYTGNTDAAISLLSTDSEFGIKVQIHHDLSEPVCPTVTVKHWAAEHHSGIPFDNKLGSYRVDGNTLPITICMAALVYHHEKPKIRAWEEERRKSREEATPSSAEEATPSSAEEIARHKRDTSEWFEPRAEFVFEVNIRRGVSYDDLMAAYDWCYENTPSCTTAVRPKRRLEEAKKLLGWYGFDVSSNSVTATFAFIKEEDARRFLDKWGEGQVQKVNVRS